MRIECESNSANPARIMGFAANRVGIDGNRKRLGRIEAPERR